ncbi:hypothetical protein Poli38472_009004 [Pythium oligandrum]|uniref:CSC1/OSCA1-like 7TM region domain-containing protein n=1 Tax=Pythium oligandrum TaxID=41045 RepID=A0A8K1CJX7_PYTOL|nr:hypothetical protein Poli38472_009004 [Pythium oligandrum]|eukprot:TMW64837.1 hypothetical protein Poli38472_009004 [Pythium oligandrum]
MRRQMRWKPCLLLALALICAIRPAEASGEVVHVPMGITTVVLGSQLTQQIECDVQPLSRVQVEMKVLDGNGSAVEDTAKLVKPSVVTFSNTDPLMTLTHQTRSVTLSGLREGRFYLTYHLTGDVDIYRLSALSSVLLITETGQGWQGILYELVFNAIIFVAGVSFFAWRRLHRVDLPIWRRQQAGLFERANYGLLPKKAFEKRYREVLGSDLRTRVRQFWKIRCDGSYVCNTCGIPAALLMRFHIDAAHLCAILSVFSVGVMLPVNYLSGNTRSQFQGNSFQQTTISNVPLHSDWYWAHVAYCYVVAGLVLAFLQRQYQLLAFLRRRTKRIVGGRSILIHAGLPTTTTKKKLRALLAEYYPDGVDEITVIYDLTKLHTLLDRRCELSALLDRKCALDAANENGTLSCSLIWLPGSMMVPSPWEMMMAYLTCRPCRFYARHWRRTCRSCFSCCCCCCCFRRAYKPRADSIAKEALFASSTSAEYVIVRSEREIVDPRLADEIDALDEQLEFFPEEAIELYDKRQCAGAAFIIFDSTAMRDDFIHLVREHSWSGRFVNRVADAAHHARYGSTRPMLRRQPAEGEPSEQDRHHSNTLHRYLSKLVLSSAPEPDDIIWQSVKYQPLTISHVFMSLLRQLATISLLLLFSTPTAVLVFVKLDAGSGIYPQLYARHSVLVSLVATYLPSLLLIAVNWALLAFLFFMTMSEASISDTRRVRSFLIKGFIYLVVSSVFLPSIGVTAAYLAFAQIKDNGKSYVESFLYKVSGTFFISYICQRTFLGSIIELTRTAERLAFQPWVLGRAVTLDEQREAVKPWPYFFGHDYAMLLSIFLVILLGTVITPVLTLFGALYFYIKFVTVKYNFLYVLPYTPGSGHIAQTSYTLVFVCLVLFELVLAFVLLQIATRKHFVAMIVLLSATCAFYFLRLADETTRIHHRMSTLRSDTLARALSRATEATTSTSTQKTKAPTATTALLHQSSTPSTPSTVAATPMHGRRTIFSPSPANLEQELDMIESYTDPYKVALSIFKFIGVNEFHRMKSSRAQLLCAFHRLKRNMHAAQRRSRRLSGSMTGSRAHSPTASMRQDDDSRRTSTITTADLV